MASTIILVLNQTTHFYDLVAGAAQLTAGPGVPIVTNGAGLLDPSFYNQGQTAIAGAAIGLGNLVNLYESGGVLTARVATAVAPGFSAQAFATNSAVLAAPVQIAFSGAFTFFDIGAEFNASMVGMEVWLSTTQPGGVTPTMPSLPNLQQSVGYVVNYTAGAPAAVSVFFLAALTSPSVL